MRYVWAALLLMCCMLDAATAATYYVANNGNNANPGTQAQPFQTIRQGLSTLRAGDTLYLRAGTYAESVDSNNQTIPVGTSWDNPVTIASAPGETATLRPNGGQQVINFPASYLQYIILDRLKLDGTNLEGGPSACQAGTAAQYGLSLLGGAHHIRFQNGEITGGCGPLVAMFGTATPPYTYASSHEVITSKIHHASFSYGFYIATQNNLIDGNEIYENGGYAIQIYSSGAPPGFTSNNIVRNNKIYGNGRVREYGAMIASHGDNIQIYNNLIYNNFAGLAVDYGAASATVYNNTFYGNQAAAVYIGPQASNTMVMNNIIYANNGQITNDGASTTTGTNLCGSNGAGCDSALTSDPGFVLAGGDFHIALAGSKAVNCCPRIASVTTDLEGANRSDPTTAGAYEFNGSIPPPTPDPDQMLGRLKFDEGSGTNAADSTGNNHFCTLTSPGWVSPGILYGSAFSLDGTRSCQIAGTDGLATPDMTVAVWMKGSVLPGPGELGCLFTIGDTFQLCVQPGGSAYFNVITDTYHTLSSPSNVQDGVARLITGVYGPSAGEGQRLFVNESQVSFLAATGNLTYPYGTLSQVGRYFTSGPYAYNGVIQDVMVFNYALDQQAIANIYNSRVPEVNVFSPHMAWVSGTTSAVLAIDTAMNHRIEEPIAVRSSIANSGPEITEFFRLAVCNVVDCDADSDWLEVKPTVNALGVYLDADPSVGLTSNTLQNLNGDGFAYNVGRYVTHIPVVLEWDASADPQVVGYKVHYGTAPGIYTQVYDAGPSLTATITGLDLGLTYYFAATAYRADLIESAVSNEVSQSLRNVTTLATGVLTEWEYRRVRFTTPAQIGHQFKFRMLRESSLPLTTYNNTPILTLTGTLIGPPLDFVSGGGSFSGTSNR